MYLPKNLRYLRRLRGYSQDYIAERLGYKSFTTIQKWESGVSEPPVKKVQELSALYGVPMNDLVNVNLEDRSSFVAVQKRNTIPILGRIAAGIPIMAVEHIEGYEDVEDDLLDYALIVKGDSMIGARIFDGDIVYVDKDVEYQNGDIVVALINGYEATLKRYYRYDREIILKPENPTMKEQRYNAAEVQLIGKVKEVKFKV